MAWAAELRRVHLQLRRALEVAREAADAPEAAERGRDLLLFCHGFCTALSRHHRGEDTFLFPAVAASHPELADTLRALQQDHSMIEHLLGGLQQALDGGLGPAELGRHLDGIEAVMESHFRYEERQLLRVLETLELDAAPGAVLGPLA
ncbi:hemerythrin domain-containing protein [Auraticoccus monumenti]|uniref:Hemerythrin HHE cation binding domain-containing protein n=1 Tax=Auraticoccus monumenti TaxID=675864 RepID=A0A1G7AT60_9ACTN|nr:hemerythrin domain-containing protein [Auraticoccus monumenti]SDE17993.1 Hemerythrin HHE cation binding domain-containing protein [Auraticoccus monumenti]